MNPTKHNPVRIVGVGSWYMSSDREDGRIGRCLVLNVRLGAPNVEQTASSLAVSHRLPVFVYEGCHRYLMGYYSSDGVRLGNNPNRSTAWERILVGLMLCMTAACGGTYMPAPESDAAPQDAALDSTDATDAAPDAVTDAPCHFAGCCPVVCQDPLYAHYNPTICDCPEYQDASTDGP